MNMEKSKVYFTDFRAKLGEGLPMKLKRLLKKAGISEIDMENKFVAIKRIWFLYRKVEKSLRKRERYEKDTVLINN